MSTRALKDSRLELRIAREHKALLEKAAMLSGCSTAQFVANHAVAAARDVLERENVITVSERDFERFLQALGEDTEPTPAAREAVEEFRRGRIVGDRYEWSSSD